MIIPIHVYIISTDNRFIDTLMILGDSNEMRKVGEICDNVTWIYGIIWK
jgi:hypothetical protein